MKSFKLLLIVLAICLAIIPLAGCMGVSQSKYEAVNQELAEIKEVYPPKYFSDLSELEDWIATQPTTEVIAFPLPKSQEDIESNFARGKLTCKKALELQESAARDGYIISANFVQISDKLYVGITLAVLENGDVYAISTDRDAAKPNLWFNIK